MILVLNEAATCLYGDIVTNKMCKKYTVYFKSNASPFLFGYVYISSFNEFKDWNRYLGHGENVSYSVGILAANQYRDFTLFTKDISKILKYESKENFKIGDIYGLSFDFVNDDIQIIHNGVNADKLQLKGRKSIIFAISLQKKNDFIHILKHEFLQ